MTQKTRDKQTMMTLYKSLVRSHLEYCCPLWNSSTLADIQQLEGVQRTFTSRISGVGHLNYWERLKALNLMSLQRRRERYIIIHICGSCFTESAQTIFRSRSLVPHDRVTKQWFLVSANQVSYTTNSNSIRQVFRSHGTSIMEHDSFQPARNRGYPTV